MVAARPTPAPSPAGGGGAHENASGGEGSSGKGEQSGKDGEGHQGGGQQQVQQSTPTLTPVGPGILPQPSPSPSSTRDPPLPSSYPSQTDSDPDPSSSNSSTDSDATPTPSPTSPSINPSQAEVGFSSMPGGSFPQPQPQNIPPNTLPQFPPTLTPTQSVAPAPSETPKKKGIDPISAGILLSTLAINYLGISRALNIIQDKTIVPYTLVKGDLVDIGIGTTSSRAAAVYGPGKAAYTIHLPKFEQNIPQFALSNPNYVRQIQELQAQGWYVKTVDPDGRIVAISPEDDDLKRLRVFAEVVGHAPEKIRDQILKKATGNSVVNIKRMEGIREFRSFAIKIHLLNNGN